MPADTDHADSPEVVALVRLVRARHGVVSVETADEDDVLATVKAAAGSLGQPAYLWDCVTGLRDLLDDKAKPVENTTELGMALAYLEFRTPADALVCVFDAGDASEKPPARRMVRHAGRALERDGGCLVLVHNGGLHGDLADLAVPLELAYPGEADLGRIVREEVRRFHREVRPVSSEITVGDLRRLVASLGGLTRRQARQAVREAVADDDRLCGRDVEIVQAYKRRALAAGGLLEFIDAPASLDDVGGLDRLKRWLAQRDGATTDRARAFGIFPPRGVLLLGVQGAGKSLASKAVATAWRRPLVRMDAGALFDRYIGESERRLRAALRQAERMSPCVLWIDEIEKAFAGAAGQSNDGGVGRRMFGTLLTWMQEHREPVFLIATANDVAALPPELLRKGRFDEIFFVDLPTPAARRRIFEVHLVRRGRDPGAFDLKNLVSEAEGYSGAEIEQAVVSALHEAFAADREVATDDITSALAGSPPLSVTRREDVAALRSWARERCTPAD